MRSLLFNRALCDPFLDQEDNYFTDHAEDTNSYLARDQENNHFTDHAEDTPSYVAHDKTANVLSNLTNVAIKLCFSVSWFIVQNFE